MKQFPYISGQLFAERLPAYDFDAKMLRILIDCANFNWNSISPEIFGAMLQGVMDKSLRRRMGAHYTSEENILKLIKPLFLDELWQEFELVKTDPQKLAAFHNKLARLKFLDPACGCGNFIIAAYRELRRLELEVLKFQRRSGQREYLVETLLKISVSQFYGFEYEEFPCQIAQVGLWLVAHQMNLQVSDEFGAYFCRLPLTESASILNINSLRHSWEDIVPKEELNYIMGNPPFNGARMMTKDQKSDMGAVFGDLKGLGNLDYVTAWYKKAADYISGTGIKCAFVSTDSIT
ncbi:MAG: N-6 DNA methylase, partial [Deltaproteobacteria bacterium]|nr:N-6 DNA methylase [Deltaproteobacteria bacterium]